MLRLEEQKPMGRFVSAVGRMRVTLRRALLGSPVALVLLLGLNATAAAAFDPYSKGTSGYDYSYPQCGVGAPRASFGIVGVNGGYPFTYYNNCLAAEYAAAAKTGNAATYINTGYDPSYTAIDGRHTTADCASRSATVSGTAAQQAAWAVGCSEAQRDLAYASSQSAAAARAWWLDVETANSWSTSDLSLNRYAIQGIVDTLRLAVTVPIGVYSTSAQWSEITGGYRPAVDANWVATGQTSLKRAKAYCGGTGFTGATVWLVQYVATYDHDYVC
jgi:hypothetical protein